MDNKIIALSMKTEAYLNNPKLTRSVGRKTVETARSNNPADKTANKRKTPHCTPIKMPAAEMHSAAITLETAIKMRVKWNP